MRTDQFYSSKEWHDLRLAALKNAKFACSVCGRSVRGKGKSRVDHIQSTRSHPELKLTLSNLRVLCPSCDNKRHSEKGLGGVERQTINENGFPPEWA
jgi:5-methylcytosine-specific restriction endonuclease McrA